MSTEKKQSTATKYGFQNGNFVKFTARRDFRIADPDNNGETMLIEKDSELEFDGVMVRMGNHTFRLNTLKGAVKAGWLLADPESGFMLDPKDIVVSESRVEPGEENGTFLRAGKDGRAERVSTGDGDRSFKARRIKTPAQSTFNISDRTSGVG